MSCQDVKAGMRFRSFPEDEEWQVVSIPKTGDPYMKADGTIGVLENERGGLLYVNKVSQLHGIPRLICIDSAFHESKYRFYWPETSAM